MTTFTSKEKLECVERELRQRKRVCPRLVASGRMSPEFVDLQIMLMAAVVDDYRRVAAGDDLFGGTNQ